MGWTISQMSRKTGISSRHLWQMEQTPEYDARRSSIIRICKTLNVPPSVLFFPEEELEKRRMFNNLMRICAQIGGITEQEVLLLLAEMQPSEESMPAKRLPVLILEFQQSSVSIAQPIPDHTPPLAPLRQSVPR